MRNLPPNRDPAHWSFDRQAYRDEHVGHALRRAEWIMVAALVMIGALALAMAAMP